MDFGAYELDPAVYDEMFGPDGAPRKHSYLSEDPILANVPTHICRRPEQLEYTLDNLDRLIVKRVGESGGYGMLVGPQATPAEREAYAREMRADPADFISQPLLALSRAPCFVDGRAEPRHVDLRPFVLRGRQTRLVPGAFCRVALRRGSIVVNSSQGGGGKDIWVLEDRMLARNAEGLYWTGRYVERTSHLCRLLGEQMETLVDRPIREIDFGWRRIYSALRRQPPGPAIGFGGLDDDFTLADSFALADDLTFERSNPDSVWNCFASGRENARQMRHCITGEMWTCLNLAYLRLRELNINDIWKTAPESFYTAVSRDVDTFLGVAERTMYRDDRWRFLQYRPVYRARAVGGLTAAGPCRSDHVGGGNLRPRLDEPAAGLQRPQCLYGSIRRRDPRGSGVRSARHRSPAAAIAVPRVRCGGR